MTAAIDVRALEKRFGTTQALASLDLEVATGEVHGFLGPNGSGKTTTIRVLLGLLRADAGTVRLLGGDPWSDAVRLHRRLAYVPGDVSLWPKLSGGEIIDLLGRLRGGVDVHRRDDLIERFELDPTKKARTYSKGNRQKVGLIAALASDAELLLLDEPTSGLDPLMEAVFQTCIREAQAAGRTVLLSSHILAEVEALCDRVSIIRAGRTVETGSLAELRHLTRTHVIARTARPVGLDGLVGIHGAKLNGDTVELEVDDRAPRRRRARPVAVRHPQPGIASADARGALPAPLRRRAGARPRARRGEDVTRSGPFGRHDLQGTFALVRFAVRRDRIRLAAWIGAIVALVASSAAGVRSLFATPESLANAAAASKNPAIIAFNGPAQALDTLGGEVAFQIGSFGLVTVALMALLLAGRLTRGEEEAGRLELLRSLPVGRAAPLASAAIVVGATSTIVGALVTASLVVQSLGWRGSLVFGMGYALVGFVFGAVTLAAAQISENARVVAGSAGCVLAIAFLLRAAGDVGNGALSWLSPIGWAQKARPFAGEQWWPLLVPLAATLALLLAAAAMLARRDEGAGLVAPRPGRARATDALRSPFALAVRLQRGSVVGWTIGIVVTGVAYGSIVNSIASFVRDNEALADMLVGGSGADLHDAYLATSTRVVALATAGLALQAMVRLRTEETALRAEPMLAAAVSRRRWLLSQLAVAALGAIVGLVATGLSIGVERGAGRRAVRPTSPGCSGPRSPTCPPCCSSWRAPSRCSGCARRRPRRHGRCSAAASCWPCSARSCGCRAGSSGSRRSTTSPCCRRPRCASRHSPSCRPPPSCWRRSASPACAAATSGEAAQFPRRRPSGGVRGGLAGVAEEAPQHHDPDHRRERERHHRRLGRDRRGRIGAVAEPLIGRHRDPFDRPEGECGAAEQHSEGPALPQPPCRHADQRQPEREVLHVGGDDGGARAVEQRRDRVVDDRGHDAPEPREEVQRDDHPQVRGEAVRAQRRREPTGEGPGIDGDDKRGSRQRCRGRATARRGGTAGSSARPTPGAPCCRRGGASSPATRRSPPPNPEPPAPSRSRGPERRRRASPGRFPGTTRSSPRCRSRHRRRRTSTPR